MRRLTVVLLFLISVVTCYAQIPLAEFPLEVFSPDVQAFEVGDSLFITYTNEVRVPKTNLVRRIKEAAWISSGGQTDKYYLNDLQDRPIVDIARNLNSFYFYFIQESKKQIYLKAQTFNTSTKMRQIVSDSLLLDGPIITSFKDDALNLICFSPQKKMLIVYVLKGFEILKKHEIDFSFGADYLKNHQAEFFNTNHLSGNNIGASKVKIIKEGQILYVTSEEKTLITILKFSLPDYEYSKTTLKFDRSTYYNAFVSENLIYSLSWRDEKLKLDVFKLGSAENIATYPIIRKELKPNPVYSRGARESKIYKGTSFGMFAGPPWTLMVINNADKITMRIGAYENGSHLGMPSGISPSQKLFSFLLSTAIFQAMDPPGISHYFYLIELKDHSNIKPSIEETQFSRLQQIDEYEISIQEDQKIRYKGYCSLGNKLIGVYAVKGVLKFIRFDY